MAEKSIGIRINLNGLNGVVKDIQTLEKFINEAREDLKQLEIGSDNFNQLSAEIARATGQLQTLNRTSEALSPEKITEGFGKLAGGITSSFAAATAAVSLFGNESEEVQEAATKAQNLLTLALSVRGVMEVKTGAQIVARTIAEKASTAATLATNTATKTLYATLAANPYGAIIAAVGLLVTALMTLGSETDELGKSIDEINKKYDDAKTKNLDQISTINTLRKVVLDTTQSEKRRQQGLDDLRKIMPEVTAKTLDEKDALEQVVNVSNTYIKVLKARADAEVANAALVEATKLLIQEQSKSVKEQTSTIDDFITTVGAAFTGQDAKQAILNKNSERFFENYKRIYTLIGDAEKRRDETLKVLLDAEAELSEIQKRNITNEEKRKQALEDTTAAQKKYTDAALARIAVENEELKVLVETTKRLSEISKINPPDPKVIKDLEQIVSIRKSLVEQQSGKPFSEILDAAGFKIEGDKIISTLGNLKDEFGEFYDNARRDLSKLVLDTNISYTEFTKETDKLVNDLEKKVKKGLVTPQAFDAFVKIREQYIQLKKTIDEIPGFSKALGVDGVSQLLSAFKTIQISIGGIEYGVDKATGKIINNIISQESYLKSVEKYETNLKTLSERLTEEYKKIFDGQNKVNKSTVDGMKLTQEQILQINEAAKKGDEERKKLIDELVKQRIDGFKKIVSTIVEEENAIRGFLFKAQEAQIAGTKIEGEAYRAVILQNLDEVRKFTSAVISEKKTEKEQIAELELSFSKAGIDITKFTEEEKLKIIKEYLEKQKKEKEASNKDTQKITVESVQDTLQQFGGLLNRAAATTSQYFAFQLRKLDDTFKKQQEQIVGDTEEANKKRIELEEQYQKEKAEIEKRAQIRSLQIQLAQAIAEGAQAVISVIEVPALAVAVGALVAAQVALIGQQLAYVQSLAGGGRIKMGSGGMVVGPSHEYGGVSYANGVNLEGGESIINRQSSLNYGGLLSTINQSGGGAPLINNASNSLMEERLLQAIARQKNEPIRAYVLSSEITNSQAINRKLDELSTI